MDTTAEEASSQLRQFVEPDKAEFFPQFFQAFSGGYGEGDQFLGIRVPNIRKVARSCRLMPLDQVELLLQSVWHEERLLALVIMIERFKKANAIEQTVLHQLYLLHLIHINNWDLVDNSAPTLMGQVLPEDSPFLAELAQSENLWFRRIAMLATFAHIREHRFQGALSLAMYLLQDPHPIIHKAVGWMLREIGNRDEAVLLEFLNMHYRVMPRTMLRYAIEKLSESIRQDYLKGRI